MPIPLAIGGALIGAGATALSNIWSAREASKNRQFQERMSSTAVQRRAVDLRAAGVNPLLAGRMEASSPGGDSGQIADVGEGASRGASSALSVRMANAELEAIKAGVEKTRQETSESRSRASLNDTQRMQIAGAAPLQQALLQGQIKVTDLDVQQRTQVLPFIVEQAKQEVERTIAGARQANAIATLDELAKSGAQNVAAFEARWRELGLTGMGGGTIRLLFDLLRTLNPAGRR